MKREVVDILENELLAENIWKLKVKCDTSQICASGQFINIKIERTFLRRPLSICDYDKESITTIYKVQGEGTKILSSMKNGKLDILHPLGNGYNLEKIPKNPVLVGGGVGAAPLYRLAKDIIHKMPTVYLGFAKKEQVFYEKEFRALGIGVTTVIKDLITNQIPENSYILACGPEPMLQAAYKKAVGGQFSFEERMGCGFGACMGCSCKTKYGSKRICKNGPILTKEEIIW